MNLLFAWRYFKAPKSTNAINIIAWVSMVAIVVGVAALIVVLSVFNGFEGLVKSLYSTFYTDLKILPAAGKTLVLTQQQIQKLKTNTDISAYSLVAEDKALIQNGELQSLVYLKGVDDGYAKITSIKDHVVAGKYAVGSVDNPAIVLGVGVENALGLQSDRSILPVTAFLFKRGGSINTADPLQSLSSANVNPAGAFIVQQEFDNQYVITNIDFVKLMLGWQPDEYSAAEISLNKPEGVLNAQKTLQSQLGNNYKVLTRFEQNQSLFTVMRVEKWVIFAILALILAVASFNMIGALTMLVMEKQKDIQVLKAMGSPKSQIQKIFLTEGVMLALIGTILGFLIAGLLCWAQEKYHLVPLQGNSFVVEYYPVKMQWEDFALVLATVSIVALLASWFPARKAANENIELKS
ncbi:MAG TPA: FtsX-like permease family protein [Chitinophagaceae bacterium]|nr:FtsX-like permease family protein [Chitinophagaceae bacterium]